VQSQAIIESCILKIKTMNKLSHTDEQGRARMVDVGDKSVQHRIAKASGFIRLAPATVEQVKQNALKKGDVLSVAEIAGTQGAKHTSGLIPLCHNIVLENVRVWTEIVPDGIAVHSEVHSTGKTGVEMEALTAVGVALLTVYDMCKAVDKNMEIGNIRLDEKTKTDIPEPDAGTGDTIG
jgi:cyclic pyranopterin phosphate synthase